MRLRSRQFAQQVTLTNVDAMPAQEPIQLILVGLQTDVTPAKRGGVVATLPPLNSPYLTEWTHHLATWVAL